VAKGAGGGYGVGRATVSDLKKKERKGVMENDETDGDSGEGDVMVMATGGEGGWEEGVVLGEGEASELWDDSKDERGGGDEDQVWFSADSGEEGVDGKKGGVARSGSVRLKAPWEGGPGGIQSQRGMYDCMIVFVYECTHMCIHAHENMDVCT